MKEIELIRWNEPRFDDEDIASVKNVLEENYVNEGPKTKELEIELAKYLGVKHVIMTSNCTASLYLAIKADALIKKLKDFEVIVPDMTMIATAMAINWAGGKVILADIKEDDLTIDISSLKEKINERTSAIIPVHILGRSADMSSITNLAKERNITIIEDAAGALGSKLNNRYLGTFGKVGCFSLQSNKIITCGQGGFVTTNDDQYYEVMRRIRDFGRFSNKEFIHEQEGYNLKFSDLAAALAISQFKKIEKRKKLLTEQRKLYENELKHLVDITFPKINYDNGEVPLWVDILTKSRSQLVDHLKKKNILTRECWPAVHRNPPFSSSGTDSEFPIASQVADECLWLPNGPGINEEQINFVCNAIKEFYR